jgi:hypothetical protein
MMEIWSSGIKKVPGLKLLNTCLACPKIRKREDPAGEK